MLRKGHFGNMIHHLTAQRLDHARQNGPSHRRRVAVEVGPLREEEEEREEEYR